MTAAAWFALQSFHASAEDAPTEQRTGNTTVVERFVDGKWAELVVEIAE